MSKKFAEIGEWVVCISKMGELSVGQKYKVNDILKLNVESERDAIENDRLYVYEVEDHNGVIRYGYTKLFISLLKLREDKINEIFD